MLIAKILKLILPRPDQASREILAENLKPIKANPIKSSSRSSEITRKKPLAHA